MFNQENLNIEPEHFDISETKERIQEQKIETGELEKENQSGVFLLKEKLSDEERREIFKRIQGKKNEEITDEDAIKILPLFLIERLLRPTEEKEKAKKSRNLKGKIKVAGAGEDNIWPHRDNFEWSEDHGEKELKIWSPRLKIKGEREAAGRPKRIILKGEELKQAIAFLKSEIERTAG